jgi:hypothetical protein
MVPMPPKKMNAPCGPFAGKFRWYLRVTRNGTPRQQENLNSPRTSHAKRATFILVPFGPLPSKPAAGQPHSAANPMAWVYRSNPPDFRKASRTWTVLKDWAFAKLRAALFGRGLMIHTTSSQHSHNSFSDGPDAHTREKIAAPCHIL